MDKRKNEIIEQLRKINSIIIAENIEKEKRFEEKKTQYSQNTMTLKGIKTDLKTLCDQGCLEESDVDEINDIFEQSFYNIGAVCETLKPEIEFNQKGELISKSDDQDWSPEIKANLMALEILNDIQ